MNDIGPLPLPNTLESRDLPLKEIAGFSFVRIHAREQSALYFGRTNRFRFDAPHQEYGALYMAEQLAGAFAETFADVWSTQGTYNMVSASRVETRCVSRLPLTRAITVCDLTGSGLAQIGADGRLTSGDRQIAQQWAYAIWQHPAVVDGIRYRVRHDLEEIAIALFDRASTAITANAPSDLAEDPTLVEVLARYKVALL